MQTRPRRTQCGVGADDSFVTSAERGRARIPVAPLPAENHGAHLAEASSRFLLPTCIFPPVAPTRSVVATWTVSSSA